MPGAADPARRRLLAALVGTGVAAVAGCSEQSEPASTPTGTTETTARTTDAGTTTTAEPTTTTAAPSPVTVASVSASPSPVRQFQSATTTVTVSNDGGEPVEAVVAVAFADRLVEGSELRIPAGGTAETTTGFERAAVGSHELRIAVRADGETLATATHAVEVGPYPEHAVGTDGTAFTCGDGTAYFAGGAAGDAYDLEKGVERVEAVFDELAEVGATVSRVWGFSPFFFEFDTIPEPYSYDEAWFEFLDHVVVAAKERDIRLSVALFNGNPAYGPERLGVNVPQFVRWADDAETRNDFFTSDDCMAMYEDWVETLVTRENHLTGVEYRSDPTIAMWELGNEIQHSPPRVGESIRPWIEDAGAFVKGLDDETLLTTGSYGHQGRNAFVDENRADPIDVVSIHYYPGPHHYDLPEDEVVARLEETVTTAHEELGKPLYLGEYNWGVDADGTAPFEERARWLRHIHGVLDDADAGMASLWSVRTGERTDWGEVNVFTDTATATLDELARYVDRATGKSTSSCPPFGEG